MKHRHLIIMLLEWDSIYLLKIPLAIYQTEKGCVTSPTAATKRLTSRSTQNTVHSSRVDNVPPAEVFMTVLSIDLSQVT